MRFGFRRTYFAAFFFVAIFLKFNWLVNKFKYCSTCIIPKTIQNTIYA